jgi:4-amino-4-deoxy-L-arabinose transferase-like glycosyltransferase
MQTETELNSTKRVLDLPLAAWLIALLLAVVFFGTIRYRLRDMPLERDEGEYAYAGQLLLQGIPPYILAYNMKLPGIYAAYAGVMRVLGETPAGIHLGLLLLNALTSILLFFLTAYLFGRMAGAVAGISYALLSTSASVMGFEAHATHFVVLPALLGIFALVYAMQSATQSEAIRFQRWWLFFLSGLLSGISFLMKQHAAFFVLFCLLYLGWTNWGRRKLLLRQAVIFMLGVILPYLATCWWMYRAGVFQRFWFWTVAYAGEYSRMGLRRAVHAFLENSHIVVSPSIPIWVLALVGLSALLWSQSARRQTSFLILFLLCSFLALCPGAYFRPHYYILLLPAVSILTAVAVSSATEKLMQQNKLVAIVPLLVFFACVGFSVFRQRQTYFSLTPDEVVQSIYGNNAFIPAIKVADYIRQKSPVEARIAVLGSEPEIYFYARRHSATGYMYMYSLIVHHKYTERMRDEMLRELETNRPLYIVFVDVWDDWGPPEGGPQLAEFIPRLREIMNQSYTIVGVADIDEPTRYVWDAAAQSYQPHSSKVIYVLRRKDDS